MKADLEVVVLKPAFSNPKHKLGKLAYPVYFIKEEGLLALEHAKKGLKAFVEFTEKYCEKPFRPKPGRKYYVRLNFGWRGGYTKLIPLN